MLPSCEELVARGIPTTYRDRVCDLCGVDLSSGMLKTAARSASGLPGKPVRFAAAQATELPFQAGSFDALLIVRVPDMRHLRDVVLERLQALPEVRSTQTSFVLEEVIRRPYVLPT